MTQHSVGNFSCNGKMTKYVQFVHHEYLRICILILVQIFFVKIEKHTLALFGSLLSFHAHYRTIFCSRDRIRNRELSILWPCCNSYLFVRAAVLSSYMQCECSTELFELLMCGIPLECGSVHYISRVFHSLDLGHFSAKWAADQVQNPLLQKVQTLIIR